MPTPAPVATPAQGFGPYETVTTIEQLKTWIAEATRAGVIGACHAGWRGAR